MQFKKTTIILIFLEIATRLINSTNNSDYIGIEEFQDFYLAENKHQKNTLRRHPGTISLKLSLSFLLSILSCRLNKPLIRLILSSP